MNEYIATKMKKHQIGDQTFIYSSQEVIIGTVTNHGKNFIDKNDNIYNNIFSTNEEADIYGNLMTIEDLDLIVDKNLSLPNKIKDYYSKTKEIVYYVDKVANNIPFCIPLNIEKIRLTHEKELSKATKLEEYTTTPIIDELGESSEIDDDITDEEIEESYLTGDMRPDLALIIQKAISGEFSLEELKEVKERFEKDQLDIIDAIDCLELQIEAEETGKTDVNAVIREKEKSTKEEKEYFPENFEFNSEELLEKVKKTLVAQDKPLRRVITEIARKSQSPIKKKEAILITGSTGVGKTKMMSLIAKHLNKAFYKVDSMQLTSPGYTGKDIEEVLWDLYIKCGRDLKKTENAIIFFDEIDKKGSKNKDDHSGQAILNMLLSFIEGATYDACQDMKTSLEKVKINTKNMIVILGGAYADVYKNMRNKDIGFGAHPGQERTPTVQDFVEKSMMTDEFMGRVVVVKLNDLDVTAIKKIMEESDESALKIQEKLFKDLGVKITFTDQYKTIIAQEAVKRKTGARGLNAIIDETTWEAYEEVYKQTSRGKYEEVIIGEETIENPSNYQLIKKRY